MADLDLRVHELGGENPHAAAAVVAGYGGSIEHYRNFINALDVCGHHVVGYEYSSDVLMAGEPEAFGQLVETIRTDFAKRTEGIDRIRYVGASLGMAVAINLQRSEPRQSLPGVYAAGGANLWTAIARHPLFFRERRAFSQNGYSESDLREAWESFHESPHHPFSVVLGGLDILVTLRTATRRFDQWRQEGTGVRVKVLPRHGHPGAIRWFNQNPYPMLSLARRAEDNHQITR